MRLKNYFFDPIYLTRTRLRMGLVDAIYPLLDPSIKCLDVGCGDRPYESLFFQGSYLGIDVLTSGRSEELKKPDLYYDGVTIPFNDNSFDIVMSSQVLEHVNSPVELLREMGRVLKDDGSLIISIPFVYPVHELPFDYLRFTEFGIADMLIKSGFKAETIKKDSSTIETIAVLLNVYIVNNLMPKIRGIHYVYNALLCFPAL